MLTINITAYAGKQFYWFKIFAGKFILIPKDFDLSIHPLEAKDRTY